MTLQKTCQHCGEKGYHVFHFPPERKLEVIVIIISSIVGGALLGWFY